MDAISTQLSSPPRVFFLAVVLRVVFLIYGFFQDAYSPMKYTDIDYYVFTDAARYVSQGQSPYNRETYRYTPLLAWMLVPTSWGGLWFSFGKVLFAIGDLIAGWLTMLILRGHYFMSTERAARYSCIWLLNPMVATISTRGSSEGLLGVIVLALLWAVLERNTVLAALLLGFGVHFKIYPFIYATGILWWFDDHHSASRKSSPKFDRTLPQLFNFFNAERLKLSLVSFTVFTALNVAMYKM